MMVLSSITFSVSAHYNAAGLMIHCGDAACIGATGSGNVLELSEIFQWCLVWNVYV